MSLIRIPFQGHKQCLDSDKEWFIIQVIVGSGLDPATLYVIIYKVPVDRGCPIVVRLTLTTENIFCYLTWNWLRNIIIDWKFVFLPPSYLKTWISWHIDCLNFFKVGQFKNVNVNAKPFLSPGDTQHSVPIKSCGYGPAIVLTSCPQKTIIVFDVLGSVNYSSMILKQDLREL